MEVLNICNNPDLLPGFRFHPTDQELIVHYLRQKVTSSHSTVVSIIAEIDIYKFNPWELPGKAFFGENEWFFFSPRDRKYPNGARPNRAAASGYWKATGTDKPILAVGGSMCLGVKKALVFYTGRPPKGVKTDWAMHEYRLLDNSSSPSKLRGSMRLDDWVLCRIRQKSSMPLQSGDQKYNETPEAPHSFDDQYFGKLFEIRTKNYSIEQNTDSKQVFGQSSNIRIQPRKGAPSFHVTSREAPSTNTISSLFEQENLGTGQFFSVSPFINNNNLQVIESPKRIFSVGGEPEDYMHLFPPPSKRLSTASNDFVNGSDEQPPPSNSKQYSCFSEFMV